MKYVGKCPDCGARITLESKETRARETLPHEDEIRRRTKEKMRVNGLSLRQAGADSGVNFATIHRFLNGDNVTMKYAERLREWTES